jgi:hypothetical protein
MFDDLVGMVVPRALELTAFLKLPGGLVDRDFHVASYGGGHRSP